MPINRLLAHLELANIAQRKQCGITYSLFFTIIFCLCDMCINTVTYGQIVATIHPTKAEIHRVCLTVGEDCIDYSDDKGTHKADLQTKKNTSQ